MHEIRAAYRADIERTALWMHNEMKAVQLEAERDYRGTLLQQALAAYGFATRAPAPHPRTAP